MLFPLVLGAAGRWVGVKRELQGCQSDQLSLGFPICRGRNVINWALPAQSFAQIILCLIPLTHFEGPMLPESLSPDLGRGSSWGSPSPGPGRNRSQGQAVLSHTPSSPSQLPTLSKATLLSAQATGPQLYCQQSCTAQRVCQALGHGEKET